MPRKNLIRTNEYPYHVWNRVNNRDWFSIPIEDVWKIFINELHTVQQLYNLKLYCFTLMSNHYHLLFETPDKNIDKAMHRLNHRMSLAIGKQSGRINKIFGGRYKWSLITTQEYLIRVYRYIYQNPVRAKIVKRFEEYPYHSYSKLPNDVSLKDDFFILDELKFHSIEEKLNWLNELPEEDYLKSTRKGLIKTIFKPVSSRRY